MLKGINGALIGWRIAVSGFWSWALLVTSELRVGYRRNLTPAKKTDAPDAFRRVTTVFQGRSRCQPESPHSTLEHATAAQDGDHLCTGHSFRIPGIVPPRAHIYREGNVQYQFRPCPLAPPTALFPSMHLVHGLTAGIDCTIMYMVLANTSRIFSYPNSQLCEMLQSFMQAGRIQRFRSTKPPSIHFPVLIPRSVLSVTFCAGHALGLTRGWKPAVAVVASSGQQHLRSTGLHSLWPDA